MAEKFKIEATGDPCAKRILRDGQIVAMALQMSNSTWGAYEADSETRATPLSFGSAIEVRNWVKARIKERGDLHPAADDIA